MIVGIDAANLRSGGAVAHFTKILEHAEPRRFSIESVVVWGDRALLARAPTRPWLQRVHEPLTDRALPYRLLWQRFRLPALAREGCDLLFAPGGLGMGGFRPMVTMSRNMLPFEEPELARYGRSPMGLRLWLLRYGQGRSYRRADGMIFLTRYAREVVSQTVRIRGEVAVIPHGVDERFRATPREQRPIEAYTQERPFRILYVSIVDLYKHPWQLAEAVAQLRAAGAPVALDLVGPAYPPALRRLRATFRRLDPDGSFLRYRGSVPFEKLDEVHREADLFAFPSSCENMPNILLEAMAAGHPIACSNRGPMPEILGDAGRYFDPERPDEIAAALRALIGDPALRAQLAARAHGRAAQYSWQRCADETFAFLARVAEKRAGGSGIPRFRKANRESVS